MSRRNRRRHSDVIGEILAFPCAVSFRVANKPERPGPELPKATNRYSKTIRCVDVGALSMSVPCRPRPHFAATA
ncbi:uncharacterized protein DMAD_05978 [Drosophila madeirensis]|uniref:Uncharacterized protein n=1 Tax=Drosophila madeirensis TaxID=30013 RepID=A0AAU9FQ42_DROMD